MLQIQKLLGLPVLTMKGVKAGSVRDVWFDEFWSVSGIVLGKRLWGRKACKAIRWQDIAVCGEDALLIRDKKAVVTIDRSQFLRGFLGGAVRLKDLPVYTEEGQELGRVSDVYFLETEGTSVIGFELTDGFLTDVLEGRRRLIFPDGPGQVSMGGDAIIVPASCERVLAQDHFFDRESDR